MAFHIQQEKGQVTTKEQQGDRVTPKRQLTDTCSFAGLLTRPSHGNYNYTGPQGTHIPTHRWGEGRDVTRGIETGSLQQFSLQAKWKKNQLDVAKKSSTLAAVYGK
jgi:hypothetical protein